MASRDTMLTGTPKPPALGYGNDPAMTTPLLRALPGGRSLATPVSVQPYPFSVDFAGYLTLRLVRSRDMWARIGDWVEAGALPEGPVRLLFTAAKDIARSLGHGPSSTLLAVQRIRRWVDDGTHKVEELRAVSDLIEAIDSYMDDVRERGETPPEDTAVLAEVIPLLQARAQRAALVDAGQLLAAGVTEGLGEVGDRMRTAERIGASSFDLGDGWEDAWGTITAMGGLARCTIGVEEVDALMGGGVHKGSYNTWGAGTGGSKSSSMAHVIASALLRRKNCLFAVLEMPKWEAWAKVIANLTGVPLDAVRANEEGARQILRGMAGHLGRLRVGAFPDGQTTVADVARWRDAVEAHYNEPFEVVAVDGIDHLVAPGWRPADGTYELGRQVCTDLDAFAQGGSRSERAIYLHATSHVQRGKQYTAKAADGTRLPGKDDLADSKHRANKTHNLFTNVVVKGGADGTGVGESIYIHVAKARYSRDGVIGPLPCDMATSRLVLPIAAQPPVVGHLL